jgi:DNA-binding XRE family transcriptional regulator
MTSTTFLEGHFRDNTVDPWHATDMASNQLLRYRHERLLTQRELGELVGVQHTCISKIERGQRAARWRTRKRLAMALEVPEGELFPS